MVALDFTIVPFAISFVVFLVLMNFMFFKPVASIIAKREQIVTDDKAKTDELISTADSRLDKLERDLKSARHEATDIITKAMEDANQQRNQLLKQASLKIEAQRATALDAIDAEQGQLAGEMSKTVKELTVLMLNKITARDDLDLSVTDSRIKETFNARLGARTGTQAIESQVAKQGVAV